MRRVRFAILLSAIALAACSSFRDVFTSHAETVARVGDRELKSTYVADIINRVGGAGANPQAVEVVAGIWVDLSLFGDRVARGALTADSAFLQRLLWPQLAQSKSAAWHDTLLARRRDPTPAEVDSAYSNGEFRIFQHILIQPKGTTAADSARAKAEAQRLVAVARADFAKTAAQYSSDAGNKTDKGYLPISPRGAFVAEFDTVAWKLAPGEQTGVVRSGFGYHIIRRPPLNEIRDRFVASLKQAQGAKLDSLYFADLSSRNKIAVKSSAPSAVRSALGDLAAASKSHKELVSYTGGSFTVSDFARWMAALAPQQLVNVRQANDTLINQFLTNLTQNTILLREADSAKITVSPAVYAGLVQQMIASINELKQAIGLDSPEFSDSSKTPVAQRSKLAGEKVESYFDKVTKGQAQFRAVPATLSAELRATGDFKVYQAGVARSMELVTAKRRSDSIAGASAPPPGALQTAPGGPPTPGKKP